jgi:hypothetical protein
MAGFFEPVIEAIAEGHSVHAALFVENHFNATTSRNWTGLGEISLAGHTWIGTGELVKLGVRFMDVIGFSIQGPGAASVSLSSESEWTGLNTAAYQDWSNADQQALFPGDRGLEYVGDLVYGQRIDWPDFSDSG